MTTRVYSTNTEHTNNSKVIEDINKLHIYFTRAEFARKVIVTFKKVKLKQDVIFFSVRKKKKHKDQC